jgi:DNA polymerase-3 subunit beta
MNLKVNRQIFLEEIVKANKIVDPKTINPELLGVLITVEEQKIIILSTNGSMN